MSHFLRSFPSTYFTYQSDNNVSIDVIKPSADTVSASKQNCKKLYWRFETTPESESFQRPCDLTPFPWHHENFAFPKFSCLLLSSTHLASHLNNLFSITLIKSFSRCQPFRSIVIDYMKHTKKRDWMHWMWVKTVKNMRTACFGHGTIQF